MQSLRKVVLRFVLAILAVSALSAQAAGPVGGGFLKAGLRGSYFNNADLVGVPAFMRKDPRIDFDWGLTTAPGGSRGLGFNSVGTENFSARWTGQFQTRFSENYTFFLISDDAALLRIKPSTSSTWTTLIDAWAKTGHSTNEASLTLSSTNVYDVELEYRELSGTASVQLMWSAESFRREVIDPAFEVSLNWTTYEEVTFADAIMNGRGGWEMTTLDAQGWPVGDGDFIVSEINAPHAPSPMEVGRMRLTFNGRADVTAFGNGFLVPETYEYNAANNQSSAWIQGQDFGANVLNLRFRNTTRTGVAGGPGGVTNVKLMRPHAPGSTESFPADELFHPAARAAFANRLTALRFQRVNDQAREWSERTPPSWPYQAAGRLLPFVYNARGGTDFFGNSRMSHEYEIMLCNETGCDYYVTVPHLASVAGENNYMRRLAQLIRFGSDAQGIPYTAPTANPYHPPLNPNLRVYVEIANELWNFLNGNTYAPYPDYRELMEDMADANTPEFQMLNYDQLPMTLQPDGYYVNNYTWVRRYWGLKIAQISDQFRAVFGDEAMPRSGGAQPRIRPYHGYQYANANQTAEIPFEFLDNYFNNGAGNFVAEPRPVSYYIFAAGGAGYYGSGNPSGSSTGLLANASFEAPAAGTWTFSGSAGIVENAARAPIITGQSIGGVRNNLNAWVGMRFRVGAESVWVYELGRYVHAGNTRSHALVLVNENGDLITYSQEVAGGEPGQYQYQRCVPVLLAANATYVLLSREEAGYDNFGDGDSAVVSTSAINVLGGVTATQANDNAWAITSGASGAVSFGPVNLRVAPASNLGNPDALRGSRVAWIAGLNGANGALQTEFHTPPGSGSGVYALAFRAVQRTRNSLREPDLQTLRITANGVDITYRGINGQPQTYSPNFPWQRVSYWIGDYFFTETFSATPGQTVTLRIEGTSDSGDQLAFIDDIQITSVDALFAGGVPDTGEATGQPGGGDYVRGLRMDERWASSYGLHHMTYEHGWSIGGDSGAAPIQEHAKYRDPRAAQSMLDALEIFQRAGGNNLTLGTYTTWPIFSETIREEGTLNPEAWPLAAGLDTAWLSLAKFPDNGVSIPARLDAANRAIGYNTSDNRVDAGEWISWNLIVRENAQFLFYLDLSLGGNLRVTIDDSSTLFHGAANGSFMLAAGLTPGVHTIKVKATSGTVSLGAGIRVENPSGPLSPTLSATEGDGFAALNWTAVPGATSYVVRYGPDAGFPNEILNVGTNLQTRINGLSNGAPYYFSVTARNEFGVGLPSNEAGVTPFGDRQVVDLVAWDFAGRPGDAINSAATIASSRVSASLLTRGAGFQTADWAPSDCFMGSAVAWGQTLSQAVVNNHYAEFTLTPRGGRRVSFSGLAFRPGFQNFSGAENDPRGVGIAWRVGDTGPFSAAVPVNGLRTGSLNNGPLFQLDLAGVTALQSTTAPVSFRIYFHGMGPFEGGSLGGQGTDISVAGSLETPPLTAWRESNNLDPSGANDHRSAVDDGISNLAKYAFNLPIQAPAQLLSQSGIAGLPNGWQTSDGTQFRFQYIRRRASTAPGIIYTPRVSLDLAEWNSLTTTPEIEAIDSTWERITHTMPMTMTNRFFRVDVAPQ